MSKAVGIYIAAFAGLITACQPVESDESTLPKGGVEALIQALDENLSEENKLLLTASFTEPYMQVQIFEQKAIFSFPDKDTLNLFLNFNEILSKDDFSFKGNSTDLVIDFKVFNEVCIHPGNGEKWDKKALCLINGETYKGCANLAKN